MRASACRSDAGGACLIKGLCLLVAATLAADALRFVFRLPRIHRPDEGDAGKAPDPGFAAKDEPFGVVATQSFLEAASTGGSQSGGQDEPFRIQFLGGADGQGPAVVKEVKVCAPNAFAAVRRADGMAWPPGANGFRLLDGGGHDVFWRRKLERRSKAPEEANAGGGERRTG